MHVVTAGAPFQDIDSYACSVALAELLRRQGEEAIAAATPDCNASVPPLVQAWPVERVRHYRPADDDDFILVDISDAAYFDPMVDVQRVVGVIDHHPGFEAEWRAKLGDQAIIEDVGAACTLVYEKWRRSGQLDLMSQTSAKLLVCGILDNNLNMRALLTTDRDRAALADLMPRSGLPDDWPEQYFTACQTHIYDHLSVSLKNDSKPVRYPGLDELMYVGQLALWDAGKLLDTRAADIRRVLSDSGHRWYINVIDIRQGKSVFWSEEPSVQSWLSRLLGLRFTDNRATADRMWLRKEIMKKALGRSNS